MVTSRTAALDSVFAPKVSELLVQAAGPVSVTVEVDGRTVEVPRPFPSPADWRDGWIYFLLVDRFVNPAAPPHQAWDAPYDGFQGGTLEGVRSQLGYLVESGAQTVWLSPVLRNPQSDPHAYHGYGIQDFLSVDPRWSSDPERAGREPGFAEGELTRLVDEAHARGIYVILDIVLNHTGDVFNYDGYGGQAPYDETDVRPIHWRDADGSPNPAWPDAPPTCGLDAAIHPQELRGNDRFRRRGNAFDRPADQQESAGDFFTLKELVTDLRDEVDGRMPVQEALIRAYQYAIACYDVDGFRIDTLKYIEPEFARVFGNAMREYALSIGKKNFFTFGEVYDEEEKISRYVGRRAGVGNEPVGVDAALDFPLFFRLPWVGKGLQSPSALAAMYEHRKQVEAGLISSHADAAAYFVTFADNHDQQHRLYYRDPADPDRYAPQVTLTLTALLTLQGIPCVYYGTEAGLAGAGDRPEAVREALWGAPGAFVSRHPIGAALQALTRLRKTTPALRYGRQYFRPVSGDGSTFGVSPFAPGLLAYSRILDAQEVLIVANTSSTDSWDGYVIVDRILNPSGTELAVRYTNILPPFAVQTTVTRHDAHTVTIHELDGSTTDGPAHSVHVSLQPMQTLVLARNNLPAAGSSLVP